MSLIVLYANIKYFSFIILCSKDYIFLLGKLDVELTYLLKTLIKKVLAVYLSLLRTKLVIRLYATCMNLHFQSTLFFLYIAL